MTVALALPDPLFVHCVRTSTVSEPAAGASVLSSAGAREGGGKKYRRERQGKSAGGTDGYQESLLRRLAPWCYRGLSWGARSPLRNGRAVAGSCGFLGDFAFPGGEVRFEQGKNYVTAGRQLTAKAPGKTSAPWR